ncbi:MAG: FtsX-like permease family protein [Candidatus Aenigmatarchaeota archaeon]
MLDIALKNITRVRTRSFLTALGILIGIAAIVALGAIADGLNVTVQRNLELTSGKLIIVESGASGIFTSLSSKLTETELESIKTFSGIKDAVPVMVYFERGMGLGIPQWWAIGIDPEKIEYFKGERIELYDGRQIESGDYQVALAGKDTADLFGLEVGDNFEIAGQSFEIVGILEKTHIMDIDNAIIIPLSDLQEILKVDTFQMIYAIPEDIGKVELLADEIKNTIENVDVITPKETARQAEQMISQIRFFTLGIGAIAAVVGGLGVMNTMVMTVMERRREIGVLKAIGATNKRVLIQFMLEAIMLSAIGGIAGIAFGFFASEIISFYSGFMIRPVVTPGLAVFSFVFALFLGLIGGAWPAWRASKLDPVAALRYE